MTRTLKNATGPRNIATDPRDIVAGSREAIEGFNNIAAWILTSMRVEGNLGVGVFTTDGHG